MLTLLFLLYWLRDRNCSGCRSGRTIEDIEGGHGSLVFDRKVDYGDKVGAVARVALPNACGILCNSLFASLLVLGIQLGL